jgi:hypothetical protein
MSLTDLIARAAAWHGPAAVTPVVDARGAVLARRYGIRYRPILDTCDGTTVGHLATACFAGSAGEELPPAEVFAALHTHPPLLIHAELELKRLAMAKAPRSGFLWVCIDPDSYAAADSPSGNAIAELLTGQDVVVNAVENRAAANVRRAQNMLRELAAHRIAIALEAESPVNGWARPTAVDADWLRVGLSGGERLRAHPRLSQLERTLADAHCAGIRSLLTGLRDLGDLALAADLGFTAVSGPLFDTTGFTRWEAVFSGQEARVA